ncbi:winged helix-turn-helix transcriptional regulator [Kitasatospora purpeofusca]|uniref:winged helix-turn-helix transcriptional regulator n=1 Tax=Kitasatospora purpeofusca TaxID=67352 RepID=UPI002B1E4AAD|nr:helix-turn-helix domain-containing protein [Kitasatospora purpeofusca]
MTPHTDAQPADAQTAAARPPARSAATALPGRPCSIAAALQVLGEKWALLAVRELFYGNHRFDRIARNTGAPRDRLTARLRALEEAGVVERRAYSERPPRYEYHLTEAGRDLAPLTQALLAWGDRWVSPEPPVVLHHHPDHPDGSEDPDDADDHGHPLDAAWTCRTCGVEVRSPDLSLEVRSPGWDHRGPSVPVGDAGTGP